MTIQRTATGYVDADTGYKIVTLRKAVSVYDVQINEWVSLDNCLEPEYVEELIDSFTVGSEEYQLLTDYLESRSYIYGGR